nr:pro-resilin-like [Leptinotarsa decemlineata]
MFTAMKSIPLFITFMSIARSEPPNTDYGTPLGAPLTSYGTPNYNEGHNGQGHHDHHGDSGEPKSYEFGYQVKDDYTGTNYNRKESSDGNQVRGEYRVALPDGRTQIVTYWADWQSGFHADVRYEGEAQFPDQYNKDNRGYNNGGYGNGGGYNGGVSNQYGAPGFGNTGYADGPATSSAINNLAAGHDNYNYNNNHYDSYNTGYNKAPPSSVYGAV